MSEALTITMGFLFIVSILIVLSVGYMLYLGIKASDEPKKKHPVKHPITEEEMKKALKMVDETETEAGKLK